MIEIIGIPGIPNVRPGDDVARLIVRAAGRSGIRFENGDVIVVAQKVVSKSEGRLLDLRKIKPSAMAVSVAKVAEKDPRQIEVVLRETKRIVRMEEGHLIVETRHGLVCANAGVDKSNVPGRNFVTLLPRNPDKSAERVRRTIGRLTRRKVAVVVSDTFGRPWRLGLVNFAIGVAGMRPILDYRGRRDTFGYRLTVTQMAVADELASAAELAMKKADGIPAAIIRGYRYQRGKGGGRNLIRPKEEDLFR